MSWATTLPPEPLAPQGEKYNRSENTNLSYKVRTNNLKEELCKVNSPEGEVRRFILGHID